MTRPKSLGPRLEVRGPDLPEEVYLLGAAGLRIGRAPGQDILLDDSRVSRHHALVEHRSDGSDVIVDLGSKSSTILNGRKLAPFQAAALRDGSVIKIVEYELIFRDPRPAV